jgi:pimeloyl-ACP methyl ester carboxylesterase
VTRLSLWAQRAESDCSTVGGACYGRAMNDAPTFLARPDGLRLACRHRPGTGSTIVFLPGYMSDMEGTKALALDAWAAREGRALLRLDYSGCGASEGRFADGTLAIWRDDVLFLLRALTDGPLVLVGSSMGGWLMLLVALAIPDRIVGLVGIAPAPDFTEWGFTDADKAILRTEGRIEEPSAYSEDPYVTTLAFWESGQANRVLGAPIALDCPVRLVHGQADADVPWNVSIRLAAALASPEVRVTLVKDGDHRLSRDADIALLLAQVAEIA